MKVILDIECPLMNPQVIQRCFVCVHEIFRMIDESDNIGEGKIGRERNEAEEISREI